VKQRLEEGKTLERRKSKKSGMKPLRVTRVMKGNEEAEVAG